MDLLGGGLDSLLGGGGGGMEPSAGPAAAGDLFSVGGASTTAGLGEIFGIGAVTASSYVPPQEVKNRESCKVDNKLISFCISAKTRTKR